MKLTFVIFFFEQHTPIIGRGAHKNDSHPQATHTSIYGDLLYNFSGGLCMELPASVV